MAEELLRVEALKSGYGQAVVVQGVSLVLEKGASLALLGAPAIMSAIGWRGWWGRGELSPSGGEQGKRPRSSTSTASS